MTERFVRFEKRKDGWHVGEVLFSESDKATQHRLFWSADTQQYLPLPYSREFEDSLVIVERIDWVSKNFMQGNELYQYERNRYFGYNGWDWDIISETKELVQLGDTALESAARAYGAYATGFFINQYGFHFENNDSDRVLLKDNMPISKSRIEKYEWYMRKAIEGYSILHSRHPDYKTFVGDVGIKLANETFATFFYLTLAGDTVRANKFLEQCQYSDSLLTLAQTYLDDTPENGILIAGGDNDTYPIWYLQAKMGYRKDVTVLNISLLGMKRYLQYIDRLYNHTLFTTNQTTYHRENFLMFLKDNSGEEVPIVAADVFFNEMVWPEEKTGNEMHQENNYPLYRGDAIYFSCFQKNNEDITDFTQRVLTGQYLYLNEYLLFDIIQTNCQKRKIAFTYFHQKLDEFLEPSNSVYLMVRKEIE